MTAVNAKLFATDGSEKGTAALPDELFAQPVHEHLMWLSVKRHLGNQRQGTAKVKTRGEVSGGGKKPFKQKGTGRARQGSNTSPLMPGGGRAFGPKPHSHRTGMPKKQRRAALVSALSLRVKEKKLVVVDAFAFDAPGTKKLAGILKTLGAEKAVVVDGKANVNLALSARNLPKSKVLPPEGLNVYDILNHPSLVIAADAVKAIEARVLAKPAPDQQSQKVA